VKRLDDVQLPFYVRAVMEMGHAVKAFSYVYLNHRETAGPCEITLHFGETGSRDTISEDELRQSMKRLEEIIREILKGAPEYGRGDSAPCTRHRGWCDFLSLCPLAGG
jgi:hypothetical protein